MPDYRSEARRVAKKYGISPDVFVRQLQQESGFNPNARSPAGAQGIAQFMPATAKQYGVNLNDGNVSDDLDGAARYDRDALRRGGSYAAMLSIYNSGRPDAYKDPNFAGGQTYNYVKKILGGGSPTGGAPMPAEASTGGATGLVGGDRRALLLQYLRTRNDPNALATLAQGLKGEQPAAPSNPGVSKGMSPLLELFYDPAGGIKNGQEIGAIGGHTDHVHFGAGPKTTLQLAKLAQKFGLTVRELAPYDKVDPVHVKNSLHYKGEAGDASGSASQMAAFYQAVKRLYGL